MFSSRRAAALALLLAAFGCRKSPPASRAVERLAVVPFENLTGDESADWIARLMPVVLSSQLAGSRTVHAFPAASVRDAYGNRATLVLHGYLRRDASQGRRYVATVEDLSAVRARAHHETSEGNWLEAAWSLARAVDPQARRYPAGDPASAKALLEPSPQTLAAALQKDPALAPAHPALVRQLAGAGDRDAAIQAAERALSAKLPPIEEAEVRLVLSMLRSDLPARRQAVETLASLKPADAAAAAGAALMASNTGDQAKAVRFFEAALRSDPENGELWNQLGYAAAYAGDFEKAKSALERYRALAPESTNPLDSMGDIQLRFGRLREAEQSYLAAHKANPAFVGGMALWKATLAAWASGDAKSAARHAARFLEQREKAGDPTAPIRRTRWEYLSGNREGAIARVSALPGPLPAVLAAVWRADASGAGGFAKPDQQALYVMDLIIQRRFAEAEPILRELSSAPNRENADKARFLLAGVALELGRKAEAAKALAYWPIPDSDPDPVFETLALPRIVKWKQAAGAK
ncbi:MAG: tetratricopeptide repeat protein [Bryobacteraceae bacterium]|nr:tetratricopeptide repeat protein [Bryobacteraceae bacterium]